LLYTTYLLAESSPIALDLMLGETRWGKISRISLDVYIKYVLHWGKKLPPGTKELLETPEQIV